MYFLAVYKNAFIKFTKEQETPGYLPAPSLAKFFKLITIGISEQKIEQLFNTVFMGRFFFMYAFQEVK